MYYTQAHDRAIYEHLRTGRWPVITGTAADGQRVAITADTQDARYPRSFTVAVVSPSGEEQGVGSFDDLERVKRALMKRGFALGCFRWQTDNVEQSTRVVALLDGDKQYELADYQGDMWRALVAAWQEKYQDHAVGVSDLFALAHEMDGFDFGRGSDRAQRTSFGKQLSKQRRRVYDGFTIALAGTKQRAK